VCLVATAAVIWWWNLRLKSAAESKSNEVQWVTPYARNIATVKLKTGAEVRVGAQLSGIVRRLNVTVGSHVRQGDVIAEADSRTIMARIDQAKTQLAQAEISLLKSQTDHGLTQKLFEAGMTIIQEAALEVIAMVDEADIGSVRGGQGVTFTTETYPDHAFEGSVARIAPVATILSRVVNYEVAISIDRDISMLRPDRTANVKVETSEHRALLVPTNSVHRDGAKSFVYIRSAQGAPLKRLVSVAAREAGEAVMKILHELNGEGRTIVLITHDDAVAAHARRIQLIRDGVLRESEARA
jgi:multidrug efflux pump subunit AcrA (membrane-fusion protein)